MSEPSHDIGGERRTQGVLSLWLRALRPSRLMAVLLLGLALAAAVFWGYTAATAVRTIHDLLVENRRLKQAITNLTAEDQIGFAKVLSQENVNGQLRTTLLFVETDRNDPARRILERQYTITGDIIHFDALIVKFGNQVVMDGQERALYLWRRVYGENQTPQEGYSIEVPGSEPARYEDLLRQLPAAHRKIFWDAIWELANDPEKLKQYGIRAIYGNVVYTRLRPGLIYVFRISNTGQLWPDSVPDM
jgi:hypothetical protein